MIEMILLCSLFAGKQMHVYENQTISSYTAIETCTKGNCVAANGTTPIKGRTAACPRYLPFGSLFSFDGKSYYCNDRTNVRFINRFDLFGGYEQKDYEEAKKFGLKKGQKIIVWY